MSASQPDEYFIYLRKSVGRSGIGRQRTITAAHITRRGGVVIGEFTDTDRTAFRKPGAARPERPGFDEMLAAVNEHPGAGVAAWHADRLLRDPGDTELLIHACVTGGHLVETPRGGTYDLATATGRKRLRDDANDATYEVDAQRERRLAEKEEAAAAGVPLGGRRAFGYSADGLTLCHDEVTATEAELARRGLEPVREIMTRNGPRPVIRLPYDEAAELAAAIRKASSGTTLYAIARDWNDRGIRTALGYPWTRTTELRRMLAKPRNAGLMEHRGKTRGVAVWPAAVDEVTWRRFRAILGDPARVTTRGPERRWLGSGIYRCSCGLPMIASSTAKKGARRAVYRCRTHMTPGPATGIHAARDAAALDAYVELHIVEWLAIPGNIALLARPAADMGPVEAELAQVRAELDEHAAEAGALRITARQLGIVSAGLMAREKALQARLDAASQPDVIRGLKLTGAALWKALEGDLGRQRALLSMILRVRVLPAPKGRPPGWRPGMSYFHPDYVEITRRI